MKNGDDEMKENQEGPKDQYRSYGTQLIFGVMRNQETASFSTQM